MKTQAAWIMAAVLCTGAVAQTWAQGTNKTAGARHTSTRQAMEVPFEKMDANGDGKVTVEEYVASHADAIKERFNALDANGDGVLTKDEAGNLRGANRHDKQAPATPAAGVTAKPIATTNGVQSAANPLDALSFEKMDVKGDGKVTLEAFQAAWANLLKARFAAMDTNNDGVLTKEELAAARATHRPLGVLHLDRKLPAPPAPTGSPKP